MNLQIPRSARDGRSDTLIPPRRGFTLIELVVAVAVTSILLSIGIPGLGGMVLNSRRTAVLNEMVTALAYARAEAVSLHHSVAVCRAASGGSEGRSESGPSCAAAHSGGWENGWLVFVDDNHDGIRQAGEQLLREHEPLTSGTTLRGNSKLVDAIVFNGNGGTPDNGRLVYCDQRGWSDDVRIVVVATTGRVRVTTALLDDNTPLGSCLG